MKVTNQCAYCLLERAIKQVKLATDDSELQMEVTTAMLKMLAENFNEDSVPSHIGTDRDLFLEKMPGRKPLPCVRYLL